MKIIILILYVGMVATTELARYMPRGWRPSGRHFNPGHSQSNAAYYRPVVGPSNSITYPRPTGPAIGSPAPAPAPASGTAGAAAGGAGGAGGGFPYPGNTWPTTASGTSSTIPSTTTITPATSTITTTTTSSTTTTERNIEPTTQPNLSDESFDTNPALAIANSFAFNRPVYVYNTFPFLPGHVLVK